MLPSPTLKPLGVAEVLPDSSEVFGWCGGAEQPELYLGKCSKTSTSPGHVSAVFGALNRGFLRSYLVTDL